MAVVAVGVAVYAGATYAGATALTALALAASAASMYTAATVKTPSVSGAASQRDIKTTVKSSADSVRRAYGFSMGGGMLLFFEEEKSKKRQQDITLAVVTTGHEIDALTRVYIADKLVWAEDGTPADPTITSIQGECFAEYDVNTANYTNNTFSIVSSGNLYLKGFEQWSKDPNWRQRVNIHARENDDPDAEWKPLKLASYEPIKTGFPGGQYVSGCKLLLAEDHDLSGNLKVRISETVIEWQQANNPQSIDDVPQLLLDTEQWIKPGHELYRAGEYEQIGRGLHYVAFKLKADQEVFPNGVPTFKFERRGAKLYDPRKDPAYAGSGSHSFTQSSTWEWSNNAALVILDMLTQLYQFPLSELNIELFIEAANACDETTSQGDSRYTINGEFEVTEDYASVLGDMLAACAGEWDYTAGLLGLRVGVYQGPAAEVITKDRLTKDVTLVPEGNYEDRVTVVRGTFVDPDDMYQETDYPAAELDGVADGSQPRLEDDLNHRFVTSLYQAQRLAWLALRRSQDQVHASTAGDLSLFGHFTGHNVEFDFEPLGITGEFKVSKWGFNLQNGIDLNLSKDDPSYYDDNFSYRTPERSLRQAYLEGIPAPIDLAFIADESAATQGKVVWSEQGEPGEYTYVVQISYGDELLKAFPVTEAMVDLTGLEQKEHVIRVATVNSIGQRSAYVDLAFTPGAGPGRGEMGYSPRQIFTRSFNQPATPEGNNPEGWGSSGYNGSGYLWMSQGTFNELGELVGQWSTPDRLSGEDGKLNPHQQQLMTQLERLPRDRRQQSLDSILAGADSFKAAERQNQEGLHRAYHLERITALTNETQALAQKDEELGAQIGEAEARAQAYTRAAVGYCIDAYGNITNENDAVACVAAGGTWLQGPLAENIRNLSINTANGQASIGQIAQVFQDQNGNLIARGGLVSDVNGKVSGFLGHNNGELSQLDFLADIFRIGTVDQDGDFQPRFYLNNETGQLEIQARLTLSDGKTVDNADDIKGEKGDDGHTITEQYRYAATASGSGATAWDADARDSDYYRQRRTLIDGVQSSLGDWRRYRLDGDKGDKGDDGHTITEQYRYAATSSGSGATAWDADARDSDYYRQRRTLIDGVQSSLGSWRRYRLDGANGLRGAGRFDRSWTGMTSSSAWSDSEAQAACTGGAAQLNDVVTLYHPTSPKTQATRIFKGGSTWDTFALNIHGSAIISDTLSVGQIVFDEAFGSNASFLGTVYAEHLEGDVLESAVIAESFGVFSADEVNQTKSSVFTLPAVNFARKVVALPLGYEFTGFDYANITTGYGDSYFSSISLNIAGSTPELARCSHNSARLYQGGGYHKTQGILPPLNQAGQPMLSAPESNITPYTLSANSSMTLELRRYFSMTRSHANNVRLGLDEIKFLVLWWKKGA